jgi:dienelactone hydrolase
VFSRAVALAGALALLAPAAGAVPRRFPTFASSCARADFMSGGHVVRAERCGPRTGAVVVVLHGCGGFSTFDHQLAADLPAFGLATLYVDYFAATPPPGRRGFCNVWTRPAHLFSSWERVVADAVRTLHRRHYAHIGAVGWSLGAGVAIAAAEDRHLFSAVAAFSAIANPESLQRARSLPPAIFLDGGPHDIVPPSNARALYAAAERAGIPSALYIYPTGTHQWAGRQGTLGRAHAAAFLLRYLQ